MTVENEVRSERREYRLMCITGLSLYNFTSVLSELKMLDGQTNT